MNLQASKATGRGPFHAVTTAAGLTPGLAYSALCGVVVREHYSEWARIRERRCPRCARIAELMKKELAELEKEP